jgi:hypothetical protein
MITETERKAVGYNNNLYAFCMGCVSFKRSVVTTGFEGINRLCSFISLLKCRQCLVCYRNKQIARPNSEESLYGVSSVTTVV